MSDLAVVIPLVVGALAILFSGPLTDRILSQYPARPHRALARRVVFFAGVAVVLFGLSRMEPEGSNVEFRGPAALIVTGIMGVIVVGFGGLVIWWVMRQPEVAAQLQHRRRWFLASFALAFVSMVGLLIIGVVWAISEGASVP